MSQECYKVDIHDAFGKVTETFYFRDLPQVRLALQMVHAGGAKEAELETREALSALADFSIVQSRAVVSYKALAPCAPAA